MRRYKNDVEDGWKSLGENEMTDEDLKKTKTRVYRHYLAKLIKLDMATLVKNQHVNPRWGNCPNCGQEVNILINHTCCTTCRQKLDWGKQEES